MNARARLGMLGLAVLGMPATALPAQARDETALAERQRAAAVQLDLVHDLPWTRDTLPIPGSRWGERLTLMAFSGDAEWLAVRGDVFVALATGRPHQVERGAVLVGPATMDRFLLNTGRLVRGDATGRQDELWAGIPYRGEANGSPSGGFVLCHGSEFVPHRGGAFLLELATLRQFPLPIRDRIVTAIAWSPDERHFALALAFDPSTADKIVVFDATGKLVLRLRPDSEAPVTALAFDLDGRSLLWSGRLLHRADAGNGRPLSWGEPPQRWLAPINQDLVLGHDGRQLTWFTARNLRAVRQLDLECGDDREGIRAVALSACRDLLAIARPGSLCIYRIRL